MSTVSCPEYPELQEKLHRLAMARDSLSLQVCVASLLKKLRYLLNLFQNYRNIEKIQTFFMKLFLLVLVNYKNQLS